MIKLEELLAWAKENDWITYLNVDSDGDAEIDMMAGDYMCPHAKEYDPDDGHGYSSISTDNDVKVKTVNEAAERALELAKRIIPGEER